MIVAHLMGNGGNGSTSNWWLLQEREQTGHTVNFSTVGSTKCHYNSENNGHMAF